ncbi:MAG: DUF885 family protein [Maricaulaceae bacterium]
MSLSRRKLLKGTAAVGALTALPLSGCGGADNVIASSVSVETLLAQATDLLLTSYPESASSSGIDTGKYAGLKSKLYGRTPEAQANVANDVKSMLGKLKAVDTSTLESDQALNVDVIASVFERADEGFAFDFGDNALLNYNWSYRNSPYVVAQNTGAFVEITGFLDTSHQIENEGDAESYLARMEAYAGQLDGETERTRRAGESGYILPDFLMAKTLGQLKGARTQAPETWGMVSAFKAKTNGNEALHKRAEAIAREKIGPAIDRQIAAHEAVAPQANSDAGIWAKPEGKAYYDWALKAGTTTNMSADEVHQMGLDELSALHSQMDPILRSIGYTNGAVGDRMTALAADPRYKFSDGDKGRAEIMAFIEAKISEIRGLMPQAFETLVPGFLEVKRIDPAVEDGAPGAYGGPGSIDGKQPGLYSINLRTPHLHNKFGLADLTYHESIPGHVWQGEYTFKQPLIRSLLAFNAYSEGWALYAQQIADELGVYDETPEGRLGYLQSLAFRACRLVVDTGLHAKRWTREQAIDWFVTNNGSSRDEVQSEIDRYCAWPGQACGYKIGHTAINRLRTKAQNELGDAYDFRRFNDAVVLGGSVPMTVLGRVIDGYIARDKA